MASTLLKLQKNLFEGLGERVLFLVLCQRSFNEKKHHHNKDICLCLTSDVRKSTLNLSLCEVKLGNEDDPPKKKRTWSLKEIASIDGGIDSEKSNEDQRKSLDFHLFFDKNYSYTAQSYDDKVSFLTNLINLSRQHLSRQKVLVTNFPQSLYFNGALNDEDENDEEDAEEVERDGDERGKRKSNRWSYNNNNSNNNNNAITESDSSGYQVMTAKESSDLLALMNKCEHAVTNADMFVEDLNRELNVLDSANVYSIMANEENIENLMDLLEVSINEAERLESRLNHYDDLLEHIRDSMDKMEGKTISIETVNQNNKKLLHTLERIVNRFNLPFAYRNALMEPEFTTPEKLKLSIEAAHALKLALEGDGDYDNNEDECGENNINNNNNNNNNKERHLSKLSAVQDQKKMCLKLRDRFSKSIHRHLSNLFIHLGNDTDHLSADAGQNQLKLASRRKIHQDLIKYSDLVHWLKEMDFKNFSHLQTTYRTSLAKLYEKDIRRFIELARIRISGGRSSSTIGGGSTATDLNTVGSSSSTTTTPTTTTTKKGLLGSAETDSIGSEYSLSERERFDDVLETMLLELETVCHDEQNFSIQFFKMDRMIRNVEGRTPDEIKSDKRATEEARQMMSEIFPVLENDMLLFISHYERMDNFFTMQALVRLGKHVLSAQDTGSFLAISLGTVLVQIKRNFDKFMQSHLSSIQDARAPKRGKCGILPYISKFEAFVLTTESVFKNSERRSDVDKWYGILVNEMMNSVIRLSFEHSKTPSEVIKMENFHHLHALLSQLKISTLDSAKREAKSKYNEALKNYVIRYFGRPLEKLNVFFEGIQALVSAGVKESEVGYQIAYSKQELRKLINMYPGKEVRKGLDNLYKKVERHLCEEENLIQVVWRAMQEEFIMQYKCIEDLIQRCYPGSQITLDFNINDVLDYFSDIAQSH